VRIQVPGQAEEEFVFVAGGLLEVQPNAVTVLAIPRFAARIWTRPSAAAKKRAEEALANNSAGIDYAKAQAELAAAIGQLAAIAKLRSVAKH
jgi:F-type H+-transporting ATPase subunit epsilon